MWRFSCVYCLVDDSEQWNIWEELVRVHGLLEMMRLDFWLKE